MAARSGTSSYARIYAVVRRVPAGRVTTYGEVARRAGLPGHARQVGYALHALREGDDSVPWHRVVNARGAISPRGEPGMDALQRRILEAEGVVFDARDRIDLDRYGWRPRERGVRQATARAGLLSSAADRPRAKASRRRRRDGGSDR